MKQLHLFFDDPFKSTYTPDGKMKHLHNLNCIEMSGRDRQTHIDGSFLRDLVGSG